MKKINIKENIKNWLLTLGIASCFGLAAFGFNASQTYKQTSAYSVENDYIEFYGNSTYDSCLLYSYFNSIRSDDDNDCITLNEEFESGYVFNYFETIIDEDGTDVFVLCNDEEYRSSNIIYELYIYPQRVDVLLVADEDILGTQLITCPNTSLNYYEFLNYCLSYQAPIIGTYQIDISSTATFNAVYNYVHVQDDSEIILSSYITDGNNTYNFNSLVASSSGSDIVLDFNNDSGNHVSYLLSSNTVTVSSSDIIGQSGPYTLTLTSELSNQNYRALIYAIESYNAPQSTGNFLTALTDFTSLIVGGITNLAEGIATGVVSMATSLFIDNSALSIYGAMVAIFAGLALAVGITTKVYTWVTTLGN